MGCSHSCEGLELSEREEEEVRRPPPAAASRRSSSGTLNHVPVASLNELDEKLWSLKLKCSKSHSPSAPATNPNLYYAVKLYLHIGGCTPSATWIVSEKLTTSFFKLSPTSNDDAGDDHSDDEKDGEEKHGSFLWFLKVGSKVRATVGPGMQMKSFQDQRRVDFVADGVWAMKFSTVEAYRNFQHEYQRCLFENTYGFESNEENKVKVFGKDFMAWAQQDSADDSIWEDDVESFEKSPIYATSIKESQSLINEFEEAADEGRIQSLALEAPKINDAGDDPSSLWNQFRLLSSLCFSSAPAPKIEFMLPEIEHLKPTTSQVPNYLVADCHDDDTCCGDESYVFVTDVELSDEDEMKL